MLYEVLSVSPCKVIMLSLKKMDINFDFDAEYVEKLILDIINFYKEKQFEIYSNQWNQTIKAEWIENIRFFYKDLIFGF